MADASLQMRDLVDNSGTDNGHSDVPSTLQEKHASGAGFESDKDASEPVPDPHVQYRMYKRRWFGVFALFILEVVAGMSWPWFGPISNNVVRDFGFTLTEVNWLGNIVACIYLPTTFFIPICVKRYGIRRTCDIATVALLLSAWVRYAGTAHSLDKQSAYALIIIGQLLSAISQPVYQVLAPKYSEVWFDLKSRTTATMIMSIANPIGGALGQILSPAFSSTRTSILVLGIISTAVCPAVFLVFEAPPTPPTFSGSRESPSIFSLIRAMLGRKCSEHAYMTRRERFDFATLVLVFAALLASINTFSVLSAQWLEPVGYSDDVSGLMGAALLFSGIIAAVATAPIFDRVFTRHFGLTVRILSPIIGAGWLSLIWAVRPHNTGALFAVYVIIGACSVALLPVGLELGCELTRNADGSSAVLWFFGNLFCIIFTLFSSFPAQNALRAPSTADPPLNMHRAIVMNGVWVFTMSTFVYFFHGEQTRRQMDEKMNQRDAVSLAAVVA
ncbi:MFS general substrate transporter [Artomyces pyxidatus]|uniref:MFS general substrate transporter n=1 Tax=Artomyces pyxidatus TaxID=48021 RepID=A0ACB8TD29_9AGAM|nr:MFS general substrate transporter [Artomyces pyxidatus]